MPPRASATALALAVTVAAALSACGGGSGGSGGATCDTMAAQAVFSTYGCTISGCHDAMGTAAMFDMASPGLEARLVGVAPPGGGLLASMCAGSGRVYLERGSKPAKGLFLDKLKIPAPCGSPMPMIGPKLTAQDLACIQSWADTLTASMD